MKRLLFTLLLGLAFPVAAHAADVTMLVRNVPVGPRALQAVAAPIPFDMLGLHWQGTGSVSFRTLGPHGWSAWSTADADSGPDLGSAEARRTAGWHDGNLDWTGASTRVQYRTAGDVARLRAYYLSSRVVHAPLRNLAVAGQPSIVMRSQWEADEKIVRAKPLYASTLKLAVVHHTANVNTYTPSEAAAIVRGIEVYHVKGNGWNDIGYNFLVDRFGTIYEGRGGGITRNVIGAHALGFNSGTVGVALIGNFENATPPPAMQAALVKLLAWRLDLAHIDPLSTVAYTSGGNAKFRAGKVVVLRAISGHRDTGPTDCPGNDAWALLPTIAKDVAATGLPKLYSPTVTGVVGGDVRFLARLSSPLPWTVTIANAQGTTVAHGSGTGTNVDWTWSSAAAGKGPFRWTLASPNVLPATGTLGGALPVPVPTPAPRPVTNLLGGLSASPTVLTPIGTSTALPVTVGFTLGAPAAVVVQAVPATGTPVKIFVGDVPAGASTFQWDVAALPDGRYTLTVTAAAGSATATQSVQLVVDRTLTGLAASPSAFSPNGDGQNDSLALTFSLARPVPLQVVVQKDGVAVATIFSGQLGPGAQALTWDGTANGQRLPDGNYVAVVTANDTLGTVSLLAPFTLDTTPPAFTAVNGAALQFSLSEPATISGTVNGQAVTYAAPAGTVTVPWTGGAVTSFSLTARDAAGNGTALSGP